MALWPAKRKVVVSVANNTYLAHHGILGMKWGVRRWQNEDGSYNAAGKARYGKMENAKRVKEANKAKSAVKAAPAKSSETEPAENKPKPVSEMTDQELNAAVNRMRLEQTYLQMITPKQTAPAESRTKQYLAKFGNTLADKVLTEAAGVLSKRIVKSILGEAPKDDKKKDKKDE